MQEKERRDATAFKLSLNAGQKRESYLYVGMDLHKKTHTAVLVNCWNEKLETLMIENKPVEFEKLAKRVNRKALSLGLTPVYGLENAYGHGRSLAVFLLEKGCVVKDVNPALAYDRRRSAPTMKKNDEYDAYCVAMVLIDQLHTLPDAKPADNYWTLSQLFNRWDTIVNDGIRLKNALHEQVSVAYPSYRKFFSEIDLKSALYFWKTYPSPMHLRDKTAEDLTAELKAIASNISRSKADLILDYVQNDGDTLRDYQASRDFITQSLVRDLERQVFELSQIAAEIEKMLATFDYKLTLAQILTKQNGSPKFNQMEAKYACELTLNLIEQKRDISLREGRPLHYYTPEELQIISKSID